MKKILITTLLLGAALAGRAAPAPTAPVPAPSKASIDQLIQLERVSRIRNTVLGQVDKGTAARLHQALNGKPPTPADQAVFDSLHQEVVTAVDEVLSEPKLLQVYEKIYGEVYTQDEVDGLVKFYQSPIGQTFADKQPLIAQKTNAVMQQQMMPMIMKIQTETAAATQKILAAHAAPAPAATPTITPALPAAAPAKKP